MLGMVQARAVAASSSQVQEAELPGKAVVALVPQWDHGAAACTETELLTQPC